MNQNREAIEQYPIPIDAQKAHNNHRTLIVFGRQRCGKSTFTAVLNDPRHISGSKPALCNTNPITFIANDLTIKVVKLHDPFTMYQIAREEDTAIQPIHLFCLCISLEVGIQQWDVDILKRLVDHFGPAIWSHFCMIIMRCESKAGDECAKWRNCIVEDSEFYQYKEFLESNIYFCGAINQADWNNESSSILDQFENIYYYREEILKKIQNIHECILLQFHDGSSELKYTVRKSVHDYSKAIESNNRSEPENDTRVINYYLSPFCRRVKSTVSHFCAERWILCVSSSILSLFVLKKLKPVCPTEIVTMIEKASPMSILPEIPPTGTVPVSTSDLAIFLPLDDSALYKAFDVFS